jgi:hypothetical protein
MVRLVRRGVKPTAGAGRAPRRSLWYGCLAEPTASGDRCTMPKANQVNPCSRGHLRPA